LSVGWPACGEIDIMEHANTNANFAGTIHWDIPGTGWVYYTAANAATNGMSSWHEYRVSWSSSEIRWYRDGQDLGAANITVNDTNEFHGSFYLLLNLALGGNFAGNQVPSAGGNFDIDWVRWTGTSSGGASSGGPSGFAHCANENGTCSFSALASTAYGANGSFNYKMTTSNIACNNATFTDPIPGVVKACYQRAPVQCASENGTCSFSGTRSVAYGAAGTFSYRTATGSIACNNATFTDPIPGVVKACYY
jgi:hypothetical protein